MQTFEKHLKLNFLLLIFLFSLSSLAKTPMFTTDVLSIEGDRLVLSNKGTKSVLLLDKTGKFIAKWQFDDPPSGLCIFREKLFVTSSYSRGWITAIDLRTRKIGFKTETGMGACAPIINKEGTRLYVFNQFKTTVSELDAKSGKILRHTKVLREPVGGVLSHDGRYLFVNNSLPNQRADVDYVTSEVSVIDLSNFSVIKNIRLENGSNALRGICITTDGRYVFVSHNLGRFQVPTSQLSQGWMNTNALSIIDVPSLCFVASLLLDEPNRGAAGIWGVVCNENQLFVSHSGTHDLSLIDLKTLRKKLDNYPDKKNLSYDLSFMYYIRKRLPLVGNGPRNFSLANGKLYIPTYFSDTLNIVDIATQNVKTIALNPNRQESLAQKGEKFFNDATYCYQNWQSCNGCHPSDARSDAMNWDLMNDGIGNPKNCKSLLYSHVTPPSMITGIRATAEMAVYRGFKNIQFVDVEPNILMSVNTYLKSLRPLPSPYLINNKLSKKAEKGSIHYEKLGCMKCHNGEYFTDKKMYRIGEKVEFDAGWDNPTLKEVWRTAPYLFDGRAATMKDVFSVFKHGIDTIVTEREIDELVEYVNSL
jgi:DNA-binding beta-propeller fold protein YncE/cytochrome c peroxidase